MKSNSKIDQIDVFRMLRAAIKKAGSQAAYAIKHNVSRQYVGQVLNGERSASSAMLDEIKVQKRVTTTYEMKD